MSFGLKIKTKVVVKSIRVKCVDEHSTEPWVLCSLYNGRAIIWNYSTVSQIKSFEVSKLPVRTAKFVCKKNWVIAGSDDGYIRVFNYNTEESVHIFYAHVDYIRCIVIHPNKPYMLSSSDDGFIKLWNWNSNWICEKTFDCHDNCVMQVVLNPKQTNIFASASLDKTVKVWQLDMFVPNFTLQGHQKGVNCVDFCPGNWPYLASGGDDYIIKIWDYQNKTCVYNLEGHNYNITAVSFHSCLPILLSASEDGFIKIWHTNTYNLETNLNFGLERAWTLSSSNYIAIGYDEGALLIQINNNKDLASMNDGKVILIRDREIQGTNLNTISKTEEDGLFLPILAKQMGICEFFPKKVSYNCDGRFVVVCGDEEYIVYTAKALRSKSFGAAKQFVWAPFSSAYVTLNSSNTIKLFENFEESKSIEFEFDLEDIYEGFLLGLKAKGLLRFYDWKLNFVTSLEIENNFILNEIYWTDSGNFVCFAAEENYFVFKCDAELIYDIEQSLTEEKEIFNQINEIKETVTSGLWIGDCFLYTTLMNNINCFSGGHIETLFHFCSSLNILGYNSKENRLYMNDNKLNITSYYLPNSVLDYLTAVLRNDLLTADNLMPDIPSKYRSFVAKVLQSQGQNQRAMNVAIDLEQKFDMALSSGDLKTCVKLLTDSSEKQQDTLHLWSLLATAAANTADIELLRICYKQSNDYSALLLLGSCTADVELIKEITKCGLDNIAFVALFILNELDACYQILVDNKKFIEAALFSRSYLSSKVGESENIENNVE